MSDEPREIVASRYSRIIERIFFTHYTDGAREIPFDREELITVAAELGIPLPKNLGDVVYSFRFRNELPPRVQEKAPEGQSWLIKLVGRGKYTFLSTTTTIIAPNTLIPETKVPDATPGIITKYALSDEQALLTKLRYNRLIDIFTGVTCYSLQNHLRSSVAEIGQVETDEIYVGIDKRGAHYVFPVQAKGGRDLLNIVQIEQDVALSAGKFPSLICRPVAAQFMADDLIALFLFETRGVIPALIAEKHYRLVTPENVTEEDVEQYRLRPEIE